MGSGGQEVPASRSLLSGFPWAQDPPLPFSPETSEASLPPCFFLPSFSHLLSPSLSVSPQIHLLAAHIPALLQFFGPDRETLQVASLVKKAVSVCLWCILYTLYKNGLVC